MQVKLEILYIRFNHISYLPVELGPPVNSLLEIKMNYAFVENYNLSPYYFSAFKQLKTLEFGGRHITFSNIHVPATVTKIYAPHCFATFPDLSNLTHLEYLYLPSNTFVKIPGEYISGLSFLKALYTYSRKLEVIPNLSHLKNLNKIWFYSNSISTIPRYAIEGLKYLDNFLFQNNQITSMPNMSYLPSLRSVDLSDNRITYILDGTLDGIPKLSKFDLTRNMISHIDNLPVIAVGELLLGSNHFAILPDLFDLKLRTLHIQDNPLVCNQSLCWLRMWPWNKNLPIVDNPVCTQPQDLLGIGVMRAHPVLLECYNGT